MSTPAATSTQMIRPTMTAVRWPLLHVAGLSGLDVAVIVPGTLDERRSGGFAAAAFLASAAARGKDPRRGRNRPERRCADRVQS